MKESGVFGMALIHENLRLHITNDSFYVESVDTGSHEVMVIDRITGDFELKKNVEQIPPTVVESKVQT